MPLQNNSASMLTRWRNTALSTPETPASHEAPDAMIKETIVLIALALGQAPTVIDGNTVQIAGVLVRLVDFESPAPKCPRARRELRTLLILAQAGALKMDFKLVPCATANWKGLCATATLDGKPLAPKTEWCRAHSPPQNDPRNGRLWWIAWAP